MINQETADYLLNLEKKFKNTTKIDIWAPWDKWTEEIISKDEKELFLLDYNHKKIEFKNYTINNRYRTTIILFRIDIGWRHINPDWKILNESHVHLYKEWFWDKWAYPISKFNISKDDDITEVFSKVLDFLHIEKLNAIQPNLS